MSRTWYESPEDAKRERRVFDIINQQDGYQVVKLDPMWERLDWLLIHRGQPYAVCEYKARTFKWGDFPDVILSAQKYDAGRQFAERFRVAFYFVVEDRLHDIRSARLDAGTGEPALTVRANDGRTADTRDAQDVEDCVRVPQWLFRKTKMEALR
jgi:hypothetical protein